MVKKLAKDALNLTKTGIYLGAGSIAISKMGGGSPLSGLSKTMPAIGAATGGMATIRMLKKLKPKKKKKGY